MGHDYCLPCSNFSINTLDGKEALLAHVNVSGRCRVGRYGVVLENIESVAIPSMTPRKAGECVVIDEIAKDMGVAPTQLTTKQPAFQRFRPDYDLFQNLQNLHEC